MTKADVQTALEKEMKGLREAGAQCEVLASTPKPILLIEWKHAWQEDDFDSALRFLTFALGDFSGGGKTCSVVRCVGTERLDVILRQGYDVEPSSSVLWIDKSLSKALEYGGDEKVLMMFDIHRTEASYQEVAADTDPSALNELRKTYPTMERSIDGSRLWLSRLPEHDRRVTSVYEVEHGRWIPGDPIEALSGVLVLGRDMRSLETMIKSKIAACQQPVWE